MYRPFKKLRLRMIEMDYNQKDLAKAAGIVPSTFSLRIRGKQPFDSAQIALSGVQNLISFDEAVAVMDEVGRGLPPELRETALGGIAKAPSACAFCAGC